MYIYIIYTERLFCRVLRAKFPKKSDKSRAPEPRVHFALSLGCISSARIRIYQPETLDEDLQQVSYTPHTHTRARVHIHIHTHTHIHTHVHTNARIRIYQPDTFDADLQQVSYTLQTHTHVRACIHTYTRTYTHTHTHTHKRTHANLSARHLR